MLKINLKWPIVELSTEINSCNGACVSRSTGVGNDIDMPLPLRIAKHQFLAQFRNSSLTVEVSLENSVSIIKENSFSSRTLYLIIRHYA